MTTSPKALLFKASLFLVLLTGLTVYTKDIYVYNEYSGSSSGSQSQPYKAISDALGDLSTSEANTIHIKVSGTEYQLSDSSINSNQDLTFQVWTSTYSKGSYLSSQDDCDTKTPQIQISGLQFVTGNLNMAGVTFTAKQTTNVLQANGLDWSDTCIFTSLSGEQPFQIDVKQSGGTLNFDNNYYNFVEQGQLETYLFLIWNSANSKHDVTLNNIYVNSTDDISPLTYNISSIDKLTITSISGDALPESSFEAQTVDIDGLSHLGKDKSGGNWYISEYFNFMVFNGTQSFSLKNVLIDNYLLIDVFSFFQVNMADGYQDITIDNVYFNNFEAQNKNSYNLIQINIKDTYTYSSGTVSVNNIGGSGNYLDSDQSGEINGTEYVLFYIENAYTLNISGVFLNNNTNLKAIQTRFTTFDDREAIIGVQNITIQNSVFERGYYSVIDIATNLKADNNGKNIVIDQVTFENNSLSSMVGMYIQNNQFDSYHSNRFQKPKATIKDLVVKKNTVVMIPVVQITYFDTIVTQLNSTLNNLTNAAVLEMTADYSTLILQEVNSDQDTLSNSSVVYKTMDYLELSQDVLYTTESQSEGFPYAGYVQKASITNLTAENDASAFLFSGCANVLIENVATSNINLKGSQLFYLDDQFSNSPKIHFQSSVASDYSKYLTAINYSPFTQMFEASIPVSGSESSYQLGSYITNPRLGYRIRNSQFNTINIYSSGVAVGVQAMPLAQSYFSFDGNTLDGVDPTHYADTFVGSFNVSAPCFWNNNITGGSGVGYIFTDLKATTVQLDKNKFENNEGSSFYKGNAYISQSIKVSNLYVFNHNSNATFIDIKIDDNQGPIILEDIRVENSTIMNDPNGARQLNFLSVQTAKSIAYNSSFSNVHVSNLTILNTNMIKSHKLNRHYPNSLIYFALGKASLLMEQSEVTNSSIMYDNNVLIAVADKIDLEYTKFTKNTLYDLFGAVQLLSEDIVIDTCTFQENSAINGNGGAIYLEYNTPADSLTNIQIRSSTFSQNTAREGAVLFYQNRRLNLQLNNNVFDSDLTAIKEGSVMAFYNTTFDGINAVQNNFQYTAPENFIYFFKFLSPNVTNSSASLTFTQLNFEFQSDFDGQIFYIQNGSPDVHFTFDQLDVHDVLTQSDGLSHRFSVLDMDSTTVEIKNSNFSNLVSNQESLMIMECSSEQNGTLIVKDTEFHDMNITQDPTLYLYGYIPYLGLVHISSRGLYVDCYQNLVLDGAAFYNLNFNKTLADNGYIIPLNESKAGFTIPQSSAVTVDYDGPFQIEVTNSKFENIFAQQGAAINVIDNSNLDNEKIYINKTNFINTTAVAEGGAIYNKNTYLYATQNIFNNTNSLLRAGAAIYSTQPYLDEDIMNNNQFINTTRYMLYQFNDNIGVNTKPENLSMTFDIKNSSGIWINQTNGTYLLNNMSSDSMKDLNISVQLHDQFGALIYDDYFREYDSKGFSLVSATRTTNYRHCNLSTCMAFNPNLPLSGDADTYVDIDIVYTTTPEFQVPTLQMKAFLRPCIPGELNLTGTKECYPCPVGEFSLSPSDKSCSVCPDTAECLGGSHIMLDPGYWRFNPSTSTILPCRDPSNCKGGYYSECADGHTGPLCDACDASQNYIKDGQTCYKCNDTDNTQNIVTAVVILLFTLLYQIWFIDSAKISNSFYVARSVIQDDNSEKTKNRITSAMFVRILNTYAQLIFVLSILNLQFATMITGMSKIMDSIASPSGSVFDYSQCIVIGLGFSETHLLYNKMVFIVAFPLVKLLFLWLYRLLIWGFKLTPKRRAVMKITVLALYMTELPAMFKELIGYTLCIELDEQNPDKLFVNSNLGYQCGTTDYDFYLHYVVYPAFVVYCLIIPVYIFYVLYKNRNDLDNPNLRMSYGVFFNEYRDEAYLWGIAQLAMKLGVMFLANILFDDVKTKAMTIFLFIYFYSVFIVSYRPHKYADVLTGEIVVLIAVMGTIFGSLYYTQNTLPWLQYGTEIAVSVLNGFAVVNIIYGIMKMGINNLIRSRRGAAKEKEDVEDIEKEEEEVKERNRLTTMQMEKALDEGLEMTEKDGTAQTKSGGDDDDKDKKLSEKYERKMKELL